MFVALQAMELERELAAKVEEKEKELRENADEELEKKRYARSSTRMSVPVPVC